MTLYLLTIIILIDTLISRNALRIPTKLQIRYKLQIKCTNLKKSFLQKSFPSLEKHFSVSLALHSQHWTHLTCQGLSSTLSKKRSKMGRSQPAQTWTIFADHLAPSSTDRIPTRVGMMTPEIAKRRWKILKMGYMVGCFPEISCCVSHAP